MIRGDRLAIWEQKIDALDPKKNEIYKYLNVKWVMERIKKEIRKRLDYLMRLNLNDQNFMKAINCQVLPVAGCIMNDFNLGKFDELNELIWTNWT